uniref:Anp1 n=1 Tax=uncultured Aspergillus TaxID=246267 RepID=A0A060CDZ2_9EURO|nr:Anp1 [uncultured Aspergillus]
MKPLNFRAIGETVYTILPFIIIALLWDHHNKMQNDDHYYTPDIPNSVQSSAPEWDGLDVEFYDLAQFGSSAHGWQNNEECCSWFPLRDASAHLPMFFGHLRNMTYPHHLIDLAFLYL